MKRNHTINATIATILILSLTGCKVHLEDIAQWKADRNTKKLISVLNDSRQLIRIESIAALKDLKAPEAVDPLGALINDPDVVIAHKALDAMTAIGDPSIEPYMLKAITFKTEPARTSAARGLGICKSTQAVELLITAMDDEFPEVAVAAAKSLGQIGDPKATSALSSKIKGFSFNMDFTCVNALIQIGDEKALPGYVAALGNSSPQVREAAVKGLVSIGQPATDYALQALRDDNEAIRKSAVSILKEMNAVPTTGRDLVWFTLGGVPADPKAKVDAALLNKLVSNGDTEGLLQATVHSSRAINNYAVAALEAIGEPATATVISFAEQHAKGSAKDWLAGRAEWKGFPSWKLDLWGGLTALSPTFQYNPRIVKTLSSLDGDARAMMLSKSFNPSAEYVPLLIFQTSTPEDTGNVDKNKSAAQNKPLAEKKLIALGSGIIHPLTAGLEDEDLSVVSACANVLNKVDPDHAEQYLVNAFKAKADKGTDLFNSEFYTLVVNLNEPSIEPIVAGMRPNDARAIQVFERKYPGIRVSIMEMPPADLHPTAEPFRLKYILDGKAKELKVVFRPDANGEWVPNPPFPDPLP